MTRCAAGGTMDDPQVPDWCRSVDTDRATQLDVRAILEGAHDPLGLILEFAHGVGPGGDLIVIAPFDPVPLRGVLAQDGFDSWAEQLAPRLWRTYFRRIASWAGGRLPLARRWQEADGLHIDTGGLTGNAAGEALAALLAAAPPGFDVVAHHCGTVQAGQFASARRGWRAPLAEGEAGAVRYRFSRQD